MSLQFVAKAIELLMQGSIASVIYLFSLEFWGAVSSNCLQFRRKTFMLLFIPFNILLATVVGPSIAILLIPRHLSNFPAGTTSIWLNGTENDLYPSNFTTAQIPPHCVTETILSDPGSDCPSSQWELLHSDLINAGSISLESWTSIRELKYTSVTRAFGGIFGYEGKATIPNAAVVESLTNLGAAWFEATNGYDPPSSMISPSARMTWDRFDATADVQAKQPFVKAVCQELIQLSSSRDPVPIAFPVPYDTPAAYSSSRQGLQSYQLQNYSSLTVSDIMLDSLPLNISINHDPYNGATFKATVQAPSPYEQSGMYSFGTKEPGPVEWGVEIGEEWAEALLPPISGQNSTIMDILIKSSRFFEAIEPLPSTSAYYRLPARLLSAMIANGMSRSGFSLRPLQGIQNGDWQETSAIDAQFNLQDRKAKKDWIENRNANLLNLTAEQAGNGYELRIQTTVNGLAYTTNGIPTKIALVVICVYVLYIFVFMVGSIVRGISSMSWDSIAKLVVLGMQSNPTERLDGASAGIETVGVFREPVSLRIREGGVQIVFRGDEGAEDDLLERVRENEAY
ncbi:uncharacterized protein PAC_19443 [Phialocephala subalpina]|uniref:Uncharacterized protein n=1 Tax=Phialocephala subalpina TaxID=576137 RepID=A0A1L7XWW8_9HELO|nr:uncharacterized protein PAC_19443 [Phialocephala subalpina]